MVHELGTPRNVFRIWPRVVALLSDASQNSSWSLGKGLKLGLRKFSLTWNLALLVPDLASENLVVGDSRKGLLRQHPEHTMYARQLCSQARTLAETECRHEMASTDVFHHGAALVG